MKVSCGQGVASRGGLRGRGIGPPGEHNTPAETRLQYAESEGCPAASPAKLKLETQHPRQRFPSSPLTRNVRSRRACRSGGIVARTSECRRQSSQKDDRAEENSPQRVEDAAPAGAAQFAERRCAGVEAAPQGHPRRRRRGAGARDRRGGRQLPAAGAARGAAGLRPPVAAAAAPRRGRRARRKKARVRMFERCRATVASRRSRRARTCRR